MALFRNPTLSPEKGLKCIKTGAIPLMFPESTLGGFSKDKFSEAKAIIITFPVNNNLATNKDALLWEKKFLNFIQNYHNPNMKLAFKAERSIEDEIDRQSQSDIVTVAVSYLIMFIYILLALGDTQGYKSLLVDARFTLGFAGVFVVLLSVISSLGFFSFLGVPSTLIIVEVIPFLILAVGVDNIFILVQAFQRDERKSGESLKDQFGRVTGEVAPSMLLSSLSMSSCFFIGTLTPMPAVRIFAFYAGTALVINFFLQLTCFLAIFFLDIRRQKNNRLDVFCCIRAKKSEKVSEFKEGLLYTFFRDIYSSFLLKDFTRVIVLIGFTAWCCSSISVIDKIEIGLEQELTMPDDSYLMNYFKFYQNYLQVGPPVYFMITEGYNYSSPETLLKLCDEEECDVDSFLNILSYFSREASNQSYLASKPIFWLTNYRKYLADSTSCCKKYSNGTQCLTQDKDCSSCLDHSEFEETSIVKYNDTEFSNHLPFFLKQTPNKECVLAGRGLFSDSVEYNYKPNGDVYLGSSYAMTYRTMLKSSEDFYESLRVSRLIAEKLTKSTKKRLIILSQSS